MGSLNKVMVMGNLGKDAEVRDLPSGGKVASFSLATTDSFKDKSGERKEVTEWINCTIWGKQAEIAEKWFKKGTGLYVEGKMKTTSWEKDGITRYKTEVNVFSFQFLGGKSDGATAKPAASTPAAAPGLPSMESDLPF
tara:strand:- start:3950 stop:4363 length:414 start_codon:yes stop_codon:yes gene_type:complete